MDVQFDIGEEVHRLMPNVSEETLNRLVNVIEEAGVTNKEDLKHIYEVDLTTACSKITARVLLQGWKDTSQVGELVASPDVLVPSAHHSLPSTSADVLSSSAHHSLPSTSASDLHSEFPEKFSVDTYKIPNNKLTRTIKNDLQKHDAEQTRLPVLRRRALVREIAQDLHQQVQRPGRKVLMEVSSLLINQHPCLREKLEDGSVIGCGYGSLLSNLEHRFDNLNRNSNPSMTPQSPRVPSKATKRDAYGCIGYAPAFNQDEKRVQMSIKDELSMLHDPGVDVTEVAKKKMADTYNLQRHDLLEGKNMATLIEEWPFLFEKVCFNDHFATLTGIDSAQVLLKLEKHRPHILDYLERHRGKKTYTKSPSSAINLLNQLAVFFGEDEKLLFVKLEMDSPVDIENAENLPLNPCIVFAASSSKWLVVDKKIVFHVGLDLQAIVFLLASYYVFSIKYPTGVGATLEFLQRYIFKINPERGSRIEFTHGKKRHCSVHPRVLSLVTALSTESSLSSMNSPARDLGTGSV